MKRQLAIYGAGGFAREVAWLASLPHGRSRWEAVCFIDDAISTPSTLSAKPVLSWQECLSRYPGIYVAVAVGSPKAREALAAKVASAGARAATLVHHSVEMSESLSIGEGSIICCGSVLTVDIKLGRHVHINLDCTIGHDVVMDDFATLAPGVHVSGNVHIGKSVYVGTGATIINGTVDTPLVIGNGAVIGAGACVTRNVEENSLYAGVPAVFKKRYA